MSTIYFVCLSGCLSVCHTPSNRFFFFVSRWNPAIFGHHFSVWHSTERCSSIFDLGPLTPKLYSPKFGTKSHISRLVWQIDRRCFGPTRGFRGWPIQWNHAKCCGPILVAMTTKFGLGAEIQSATGLSYHSISYTNHMPNAHRRRDSTRQLRRDGVGDMYRASL